MVDQATVDTLVSMGFRGLGYFPPLWTVTTPEGHTGHIASTNPEQGWYCVLHGKGATVHTPPIASHAPVADLVSAATWLLIESANHG